MKETDINKWTTLMKDRIKTSARRTHCEGASA